MDLPAGTRNYSYAEDMAIFRTKTHWFLLIALLVILFTAPTWFGNYWLSVANRIGITIIAVTGLNILTGYCGQLSIGQAGFMAVGAYTSAILTGSLPPAISGWNTERRHHFRFGRHGFRHPFFTRQRVLPGNLDNRRSIYHSLGNQSLDKRDRRVRRHGSGTGFNRRHYFQKPDQPIFPDSHHHVSLPYMPLKILSGQG